MSELHEALQALGHVDYTDVPTDNLAPYLQQHFAAGELICNSVPPPPGGNDFESSTAAHAEPNLASSSKDIIQSSARAPPPDSSHIDLRGSWGKPLKLSAKDNPLGISVYKMAGHDRHGAWFARRSVHEGISFTKFKQAMQWEFPESLGIQGGPGTGNVRGIGGDRRLEKKKVDGIGQLEVFELSAQFPGPTTPREFLTLLLTGSGALSEKSSHGGTSPHKIPRHFMVVSKPTSHPDAPDRSGYIRGHYESVELIQEIPLHHASGKAASTTDLLQGAHSDEAATGRARGSTIGFAESRGPNAKGEQLDKHETSADAQAAELNPVEWIMVTRSDPGGGIPRFMVERGTPGGICTDASKFFDWACAKDTIPNADDDGEIEKVAAEKSVEASELAPQTNGSPAAAEPQVQAQQTGVFSHLTNALEAGITSYAPTGVAEYTHQYLHGQTPSQDSPSSESDDDSSSYASADDFMDDGLADGAASVASLTLSDTQSTKQLSPHDKELRKLLSQQHKLDEKLAKQRAAEAEKLRSQQEKEANDSTKAQQKHDKEIKKREEKHAKEVAKLEQKREKELRKAEERRRKQADRDVVGRVSRERDEFRDQVDLVRRENGLLREQVGEVQRENTLLVARLSKVGGEGLVKSVREEIENVKRERSGSMKSRSSRGSGENNGVKEK